MCFAVFIATVQPQKTSGFIPNVTNVYLRELTAEELVGLCDKFSLDHIYYVGSASQCSCDFNNPLPQPDNTDSEDNGSVQAFFSLINRLANIGPVEYYCCWDGDWREPIETTKTLDVKEINMDEDYWILEEGEFISFLKN